MNASPDFGGVIGVLQEKITLRDLFSRCPHGEQWCEFLLRGLKSGRYCASASANTFGTASPVFHVTSFLVKAKEEKGT
jgi:hypothetical protein